ncbi:MAG TPA: hypothetical protein VFS66_11190 [Acidimicrobiia bacterium]|nr:hypothetical protein [Acidimicrobiia bacterium]
MPRARFFYGVSAGCGIGWLLITFELFAGWILLAAALTLGIAIALHRQHQRQVTGRRWRRTHSLFGK